MKYLFSLILFTFGASASEPFIKMECPEYNEELALKLDPNKKYFRDTVRARVEFEVASEADISEFHQQFGIKERRIVITNNEQLALEIGAPIVYSMKYYTEKYFGRTGQLTTHHVPAAVTYKTPYGYIAGDSQGEFGGELVFVSNAGTIELLKDMNVEDIYKFDFGYVVTEGLSHMSGDRGALQLVTFINDKPQLKKLFGLIGAPRSSVKLSDGDLLINSRDGSQILTNEGTLVRVSCIGR